MDQLQEDLLTETVISDYIVENLVEKRKMLALVPKLLMVC